MVKLFNPCSAVWLVTEFEPDDHRIAYGLFNLGMGFLEREKVSLTGLAPIRGLLGLSVERDLHFEANRPISAYIEQANWFGYG